VNYCESSSITTLERQSEEIELNKLQSTRKTLPNKIHSPKDFDIILFPSSLFYRTIPLISDFGRFVIPFDFNPAL